MAPLVSSKRLRIDAKLAMRSLVRRIIAMARMSPRNIRKRSGVRIVGIPTVSAKWHQRKHGPSCLLLALGDTIRPKRKRRLGQRNVGSRAVPRSGQRSLRRLALTLLSMVTPCKGVRILRKHGQRLQRKLKVVQAMPPAQKIRRSYGLPVQVATITWPVFWRSMGQYIRA